MQQAILVQIFDDFNIAIISAIGSISEILELKTKADLKVKERSQSQVPENQAQKNAHILYPTFHVLIMDQQFIDRLSNRFNKNEMSYEVYKLVQNMALIENY